ncbi:uncharacterized protein LOC143718468 [Siphateles boraxobius]|uniref:uncharacterized protein LOC143718468 n=1 Tax=Siphateles boraxobius TaxID=180520 RepID=UPI0040633145
MPEMKCEACKATWSAGVDDLVRNDYWPATLHFSTTGKITADSFRKSFLEWEAVRFEVDKICREEHFICPACTPDMLAVSVDGNRKHYRFKSAARSLEEVSVEGSGQLPGKLLRDPLNKLANKSISFFAMDVTCKYWPYLNKVIKSCPELQHLLGMKPFLSVFLAKAHDFKCEVKWSGAYQKGAGLTLGEEVEQCNAFLSRIAVTTKHMSKAGRTDMLTLMAMRWNQQKFNNLAASLACRYQKATKRLESQLQDLESMRIQLAVTQVEVEDWVTDIKEWAEADSYTIISMSQSCRIMGDMLLQVITVSK